jgi:tRNA nucleotidyltransferase (CCA-adding enzyme)
MGRHLIERGLQPGPPFTPILNQCFEAQLEGEFHTLKDGLCFLDQTITDSQK